MQRLSVDGTVWDETPVHHELAAEIDSHMERVKDFKVLLLAANVFQGL